jgi:hypothetical protein
MFYLPKSGGGTTPSRLHYFFYEQPTMNNEPLHFSIKNAPPLHQIWEKIKIFSNPLIPYFIITYIPSYPLYPIPIP